LRIWAIRRLEVTQHDSGEYPWKLATQTHTEISHESMKEYFKTQLNSEEAG
jgi:hypothetical protein